jgi:glutamyl-tRNA synthetase
MGWDHHAATPDLDPADIQTREVFSKQDLIDKFDISHVNHKRAAVDLGKLDFLNKMHLRRMGQASGVGEKERLIQRYRDDLRQQKVLQGW